MRARDLPTLAWSSILLGGWAWLAIVVARPAATTTTTPPALITEHVNKTCLLSGDCDAAPNLDQLRYLQRHVRHDVDPCVDFYQHACGNWAQDATHQQANTMMQYGDGMVAQRHVELFRRAQQQRRTADPILEKMLHYYEVCLRVSQTEQRITLHGYVAALSALGTFNVSASWLDTLARLGRYGYAEHFVVLHAKQRNASQHEVQLLPHNTQARVKIDDAVYAVLRLHTQRERASLERDFRQLEDQLELIVNHTLANCPSSERDEQNECDLFRYYRYEELVRAAPHNDWQRFITLHLGRAPQSSDVYAVEALSAIVRLVQHVDGVDAQLRALYTLARFLNYLQLQQRPFRVASPANVELGCVRHMRKTLLLPMLYIYEQEYYAERRAANAQVVGHVFAQLKAEFARTLARNELQLGTPALKYLGAKLEALRLNLGNLPTQVGLQFFVEFLSTLTVSGNFYLNHLNALQHYYAQLRTLVQGGRARHPAWYTFTFNSPDMPDNLDSTAYYHVLSNMIVLPYAYLQTPFYDARYWPALLYGDLANTLGHEIMHAFDNNFLSYDYAGNMDETSRLIETNAEYRRRLSALSRDTEFPSECIADVSGSRLALQTFLRDEQFRRSNGKLYFLQFAQFFCGNEHDVTRIQLEDDTHDINSLRLNYTLANLPEFAEVFACAPGTPMNHKTRNTMW